MLQLPIFAYVIAAAVLLASGFGAGWKAQGNIAEAKISRMNVAAAKKDSDAKDDLLRAQETARLAEQALSTKYQGALNEARAQTAAVERDRDRARAESDRLREQSADAARRLAKAPPAAVVDYALAVGDLLAQCGREYQALAGKADGHAGDVRAIIAAWPINPPR